MMKKIICSIGLIVAACSVAVICSSCGKKEERGELKRIWYNGSYNRDFKDLNDVHLAEAKRIGIQPASNREEAEKVKKEMEEIGRWLKGAKRYFLQPFVDSGSLVSGGVQAHTRDELARLRQAVLPYIPNTQLRGI